MNKALDFRNKAQSQWPGATVHGRGKNWIRHQHPTNPTMFMLDQSMTPVHYGASFDQEIDSAWEPDTGAWQYKMVKAGHYLHARNVLNAGDTIQWLDPVSGESVTLQPLALNWVDNLTDSRQQIALPQAVTAQASGDVLYWENGYGTGRHFRYISGTGSLVKHFIIDSATYLPAPTVSNPYLEVEFTLTKSSGVTLYVDGQPWDNSTRVTTANTIEFRLSNGTAAWGFKAPRAWDAGTGKNINNTLGIFELHRQGAVRYCTVRIPKTWVDTAVFPITIDPSIDESVIAGSDDALEQAGDGTMDITSASYDQWINGEIGGARFQTIALDGSENITSNTYLSIFAVTYDWLSCDCTVTGEDIDDAPTFATSYYNISGRTDTSASVVWTATWNAYQFNNSPSISSIIQEIIDRAGWASGNDIVLMWLHRNSADFLWATDNWTPEDYAPRLHIEYTSGTASSFVIPRKNKTYLRR